MRTGMIDLCIVLGNYGWHLAKSSTVFRQAPNQSQGIKYSQITSECIDNVSVDLKSFFLSSVEAMLRAGGHS